MPPTKQPTHNTGDEMSRLLHTQRILEDIRRLISQTMRPFEAILCRVKSVEDLIGKLKKTGPHNYPEFLVAILNQLESKADTLRISEERNRVCWDEDSDYTNETTEKPDLANKTCLNHALEILGRTFTDIHECDVTLTEPLLETMHILDDLFEKINQGTISSAIPAKVLNKSTAKQPEKSILVEPTEAFLETKAEIDPKTPEGWQRIASVNDFLEKNLMENSPVKGIRSLIPESAPNETLFTDKNIGLCSTNTMGELILSDNTEVDVQNNPAEVQHFLAAKSLHIEETLLPTDNQPMQYRVSTYIDKTTSKLMALVEEIIFIPSKEVSFKTGDLLPQVVSVSQLENTLHEKRIQI